MIRDLLHRLGIVEVVTTANKEAIADHETRIRGLEHLTAKVTGGAIVGSAVGGWILSQIVACSH
jgi:hypothetical protein